MPNNSNRANSMGAGVDMEAGIIGLVFSIILGSVFFLTVAALELALAAVVWLAEQALRPR
jgi:heme/copper-type cytochrome/quinol oxidase subunit 4